MTEELERGEVAIIVPRRSDNGGRRDELWKFTLWWLSTHHPGWLGVTGDSPDGPFNRGAALNDAAATAIAQGARVLIVHDGDNITSPERLELAVNNAHITQRIWFPSDCYMYLDRASSDELMVLDDCHEDCHHFFPRPSRYRERSNPAVPSAEPGYNGSVRNKHISGIMAVPTPVWQKIGGFVPLTGWGREDSIFWLLAEHHSQTPVYIEGTTLHLFHEHKEEDTTREIKRENSRVLREFRVALQSPTPAKSLARLRKKYGLS